MMPDSKRKELGIASVETVERLKHTLDSPVKKGEHYLEYAPAILCQSWDEQLYYECIAENDIDGPVVFMPYVTNVVNDAVDPKLYASQYNCVTNLLKGVADVK